MSQDNVRVMRAAFDAWNAQDMTSFQELLDGDFIDAGDHIAARYIWHGTGHGPTAAMELTVVLTVRNGRIVEIRHFWDHAEALEAAGLRE